MCNSVGFLKYIRKGYHICFKEYLCIARVIFLGLHGRLRGGVLPFYFPKVFSENIFFKFTVEFFGISGSNKLFFGRENTVAVVVGLFVGGARGLAKAICREREFFKYFYREYINFNFLYKKKIE